jgi:hypothetical protein
VAEPDDTLDDELDQLLTEHDVAGRLVDILSFEVFEPARTLMGDGAIPWIASTLRTTAAMIERLHRP